MRNKSIEDGKNPKLIGSTWRKYPTVTSKQKATYGLFECQYCKKEFEALLSKVKGGDTRSCGCLKGKASISHGLESNRFYNTWHAMVTRCNNPKDKGYKNYGGRGITVCEEWLDIKNFVVWAEQTHPNISGVSLDRIDNDKGYSPDNCRWANKTTQAINQRIKKNNTSGYVGVRYHSRDGVWTAYISVNNTRKYIGSHKTKEEAVLARDNYIIENKLPHKLSTDYMKDK